MVDNISEESVQPERSTFIFYYYNILHFCQTNLIMERIEALGEWTEHKIIRFNILSEMRAP